MIKLKTFESFNTLKMINDMITSYISTDDFEELAMDETFEFLHDKIPQLDDFGGGVMVKDGLVSFMFEGDYEFMHDVKVVVFEEPPIRTPNVAESLTLQIIKNFFDVDFGRMDLEFKNNSLAFDHSGNEYYISVISTDRFEEFSDFSLF